MEHYKERDRESIVSAAGFNVTVNGEILKGITNVANGFSNLFITIS
jgi:hypothetical protein